MHGCTKFNHRPNKEQYRIVRYNMTGRLMYIPKEIASAKLALGVALLYAGSVLAVDNIVDIADSIGVSEKIIGITVLAIGTSLPELITSVAAIRRGETNIGIGNILGSNIYNILMIAGVAAIISGITAPKLIEFDYIIMLAFGAAMLILLRGRIARREGIILTTAYVAYLGFLILF